MLRKCKRNAEEVPSKFWGNDEKFFLYTVSWDKIIQRPLYEKTVPGPKLKLVTPIGVRRSENLKKVYVPWRNGDL